MHPLVEQPGEHGDHVAAPTDAGHAELLRVHVGLGLEEVERPQARGDRVEEHADVGRGLGGDDLVGAELHFGDAADAEHLVVGAVAGEVRGDRHVAELRPGDGAAFIGHPAAAVAHEHAGQLLTGSIRRSGNDGIDLAILDLALLAAFGAGEPQLRHLHAVFGFLRDHRRDLRHALRVGGEEVVLLQRRRRCGGRTFHEEKQNPNGNYCITNAWSHGCLLQSTVSKQCREEHSNTVRWLIR